MELDKNLLLRVIDGLEYTLDKDDREMPPEVKAKWVLFIYEYFYETPFLSVTRENVRAFAKGWRGQSVTGDSVEVLRKLTKTVDERLAEKAQILSPEKRMELIFNLYDEEFVKVHAEICRAVDSFAKRYMKPFTDDQKKQIVDLFYEDMEEKEKNGMVIPFGDIEKIVHAQIIKVSD